MTVHVLRKTTTVATGCNNHYALCKKRRIDESEITLMYQMFSKHDGKIWPHQ